MGGIVLVVVLVLDTRRQARLEKKEDHAVVRAILERTQLRCIVCP